MIHDRAKFIKAIDGRYWRHLKKETLIPFQPPNRLQYLPSLHERVSEMDYTPGVPRGVIVSSKQNGVARFIPAFRLADSCVYYFCVKMIEDEIAHNRVSGTFGGFRLGGALRRSEEKDDQRSEMSDPGYGDGAFDKFAWLEAWKGFQKIALELYDTCEYPYFAIFDIANFYDSVKLDRLEAVIRQAVREPKKTEVIDLLMFFIRNSNRKNISYFPSTLGIPQEEVGDCSRILANFYLQEYDLAMSQMSIGYDAKYLRFADDQIVGARNESDAREIIFRASKLLLKYGLNLNAYKVKVLNRIDFGKYWAFDIMSHLLDQDSLNVGLAYQMYVERVESDFQFRDTTVARRFLSLDSAHMRPYIEDLSGRILTPNAITQYSEFYLERLYKHMHTRNMKESYLQELNELSKSILCTEYHLRVLKFARQNRVIGKMGQVTTSLERVESL